MTILDSVARTRTLQNGTIQKAFLKDVSGFMLDDYNAVKSMPALIDPYNPNFPNHYASSLNYYSSPTNPNRLNSSFYSPNTLILYDKSSNNLYDNHLFVRNKYDFPEGPNQEIYINSTFIRESVTNKMIGQSVYKSVYNNFIKEYVNSFYLIPETIRERDFWIIQALYSDYFEGEVFQDFSQNYSFNLSFDVKVYYQK